MRCIFFMGNNIILYSKRWYIRIKDKIIMDRKDFFCSKAKVRPGQNSN